MRRVARAVGTWREGGKRWKGRGGGHVDVVFRRVMEDGEEERQIGLLLGKANENGGVWDVGSR